MSSVCEVSLVSRGDSRGNLIALEAGIDVPFEIKRVYYVFDTTPGTLRGCHAHRDLKQLLICVSGACTLVCEDSQGRGEFYLDWPNKGLLVEGLVWREMKDFSKGAVLLVLASEHYDEFDYIRDYDTFRKELLV